MTKENGWNEKVELTLKIYMELETASDSVREKWRRACIEQYPNSELFVNTILDMTKSVNA